MNNKQSLNRQLSFFFRKRYPWEFLEGVYHLVFQNQTGNFPRAFKDSP